MNTKRQQMLQWQSHALCKHETIFVSMSDFEDLNMMELGLSKQVIKEEIYVPCHKSRGWIRCFVAVDADTGFRYAERLPLVVCVGCRINFAYSQYLKLTYYYLHLHTAECVSRVLVGSCCRRVK